MNILIIIGFIIWYIIGFITLVYDWTGKWDLDINGFIVILHCSVIGPFAFILFVVPELLNNKIIMKKRGNE